MQKQYVPEIDVLIAAVRWLHRDGWTIEKLSIARGQGIDSSECYDRAKVELFNLGINEKKVRFASTGEDIRARKDDYLMRIECKGLAESLKPGTIRNQFDRSLASVVSYFDQGQGLLLGLAVPEECYKLVKNKLPQALRTALNLWILLYVSADRNILALSPHEGLP